MGKSHAMADHKQTPQCSTHCAGIAPAIGTYAAKQHCAVYVVYKFHKLIKKSANKLLRRRLS